MSGRQLFLPSWLATLAIVVISGIQVAFSTLPRYVRECHMAAAGSCRANGTGRARVSTAACSWSSRPIAAYQNIERTAEEELCT